VRHLFHKENGAVAWPQDSFGDDLGGIGVHVAHHFTSTGVGRARNAQIMTVERLIDDTGVAALGKGIHECSGNVARPRPHVDAFDWHRPIVLDERASTKAGLRVCRTAIVVH
jgi:hypothetical protein